MKSYDSTPKVLYVGDSRRMKGGVSAVIQTIEKTPVWDKYHCNWLECQINGHFLKKIIYLVRKFWQGLFLIPRYDFIHFHTAVGNSMITQLPFFLYAKLLRKLVILHLHVGDQLKDKSSSPLFRFYCRKSDHVITLGDSLRKYVPVPPGKVDFLYNPAPAAQPKREPHNYFLFAAYIDSAMNKGHDVLLKAFASVIQRFPGWRMVICGDGDMELLNHLIRLNGVEDYTDTPGWVIGEEKERLFRNAYAYCLTSRKEGLPVTVLESLSFGLPVIATPVGSLPEFLVDGETVLFTAIDDPVDLANKMCQLILDKDLYDKLSKNSVDLANNRLSIAKFSEKLDSIYSSLCE